MQYLIAFLEGMITFISPCLLPMLPIYLSYFMGSGARNVRKSLVGALGFVLGFTVVFVAMGALAGTVGGALRQHQKLVNLVSGLVVIFFGLSFLGVFRWTPFRGSSWSAKDRGTGFFPSLLLGVVFSLGWTPCVGAFLGSALMLASQQGHLLTGMLMLLSYAMGLGVPFVISAVLIDELKTAFTWIKGHYTVINRVSGALLILLGLLMATGALERILSLLS